jgi:hypothetical protein
LATSPDLLELCGKGGLSVFERFARLADGKVQRLAVPEVRGGTTTVAAYR